MKYRLSLFMRCCAFLFMALFMAPIVLSQNNDRFRSWNQPVAPFRISANIYYVGTNEIACYLITTPEGHILLDGGFEESAPLILKSVQQLGFDPKDIKILLNNHAHLDHAGGFAELKRVTGAKLVIMKGDVEQIKSGGKVEPYDPDLVFPPVEVDGVLQDGEQVQLGGTVLTAHRTAGHTKGCTTWTTQVKENGKSYNVVFAGSPTVLPDVPLQENKEYPQIEEDYRHTFEVLRALPCDIFLSGHGSFFSLESKRTKLLEGVNSNPFIDPEGYQRFVGRCQKAFLDRLNNPR